MTENPKGILIQYRQNLAGEVLADAKKLFEAHGSPRSIIVPVSDTFRPSSPETQPVFLRLLSGQKPGRSIFPQSWPRESPRKKSTC